MKKTVSAKKNILSVIIVIALMSLSGCGFVEKNAAKAIATRYIVEKYGFVPVPQKAKEQRTDSILFGVKTGMYLVTMKHGKETFEVFTPFYTDEDVRDNYQAELIGEALKEDITKCVGEEPYKYNLVYDNNTFDEYDRKYDNFFNTFYDGTNLYEVLKETYDGKINMIYIDGLDVRDIDLSPVYNKFDEAKTEGTYNCLYINLCSYLSEDDFTKDMEKALGNDVHAYPYSIRLDLPNIYDAQCLSYKDKSKSGDKLSIVNPDNGFLYDYKTDEYSYYGDLKE